MESGQKALIWRIEEILSLVAAVVMFLVIVMLIVDMFSFMNAPEDYINPHQLDTTKSNWKLSYLGGSALAVVRILIGLILYFLSYKLRQQKYWQYIRLAVTLFILGAIGISYYQWYLTGFDH